MRFKKQIITPAEAIEQIKSSDELLQKYRGTYAVVEPKPKKREWALARVKPISLDSVVQYGLSQRFHGRVTIRNPGWAIYDNNWDEISKSECNIKAYANAIENALKQFEHRTYDFLLIDQMIDAFSSIKDGEHYVTHFIADASLLAVPMVRVRHHKNE